MRSPSPSAGLIASGLTLSTSGTIAVAWGLVNPDTSYFGDPTTSGWVTAGGVAFIVGSLLTVWGVYRLANAVDLLFGDLIERKMAERRTE